MVIFVNATNAYHIVDFNAIFKETVHNGLGSKCGSLN